MNRIIFIFLLLTCSDPSISANNSDITGASISATSGISDGWYSATVKYSNYSTGTYATYTLDVKVEYNSITAIDFGKGGSVHSGYNNEGYQYSGGSLSFEYDYGYTSIVAATATVTIYDTGGMKYFKIRIE